MLDFEETFAALGSSGGGGGGASVNKQVTLSASDWVGNDAPYVLTATVTDMTADIAPIIGLVVSPAIETGNEQIKQWGYISRAVSGENIITFYCYKNKPTIELTANVKVI